MQQLLDQLAEFWCTTMHEDILWPIHGHYQCAVCLREYPVLFEVIAIQQQARRDEYFGRAVALRRA